MRMRYSDDLIDRVRMSNDIVDVVGSYVKLTRKGANYMGLCPFHNEKTASFSVSGEKQMYYCFGCQRGGSVFTFLMEYENYSFPEAVKSLAERAGIPLPEGEESEEEKREASHKSMILKANKEAAIYYYKRLYSEGGETGLAYFRKRGLSDDTIRGFGLGYSGKGGSEIVKYLKSKGFSDKVILDAGLSNVSEKYGMRDRFWNRVMFPIMDINSKVIGFGGRVLGDGEPKYLNSPETIVFDKSSNMYGLNEAKRSRKDYRIVCEGYMDVISMHQAGFTEAVASLGTAFTMGHAMLIGRYTKDVRLTYDSDGAGVKAALRAIQICREAGLTPRVVNLKPYKDPDEFIKAEGAEEFQKRINEAENAFFFEMRMLEDKFDMNDPSGRTRFEEEMALRLTDFPDELERNNYIASMAQKYAISEPALKQEVVKKAAERSGLRIQKERFADRRREEEEAGKRARNAAANSEMLLLTWISDEKEIYDVVKGYLEPEDFTDDLTGRTARMLFGQLEKGEMNLPRIIDSFEEEEGKRVAEIFHAKLEGIETKEERSRALTDLVVRIKEEGILRKMDEGDCSMAEEIRMKQAIEELRKLKITV